MCGITAVISNHNIFEILYESLFHLQHRGQNSFGFAVEKDKKIKLIKDEGLLINSPIEFIDTNIGIGHVRYPTSGNLNKNEIQPFILENVALCHNGTIANYKEIKDEYKFFFETKSDSDSELLLNVFYFELNRLIISKNKSKKYYKLSEYINDDIIVNVIKKVSAKCKGGYSVIIMIPDYGLICFKDPFGIRPLVLGSCNDSYIISSESSSISNIGDNFKIINELNGGEIFILKKNTNNIITFDKFQYSNQIQKPCIFEWIYIAREDSIIHNVSVYESRLNMGMYLARKMIKENIDINNIDAVIPIPDTSRPVALKIAEFFNIPYREAIIKNRYIGRTFIMDNQIKRKKNIKRKLSIIDSMVVNKNILIVDDSIVRGNTINHIIKMLYNSNVKSIIVASSAPMIKYQNFYGLDIPTKEELIANNTTIKNIEKKLNIKRLIFLSIDEICKSVSDYNQNLIDFELSVFDGKYIH